VHVTQAVSGAYPSLLRRRSLAMLRLAEELVDRGEHDLAALNAEYAAQLYVEQLGFHREADEVASYVKSRRRLLAELEEAHVRAVYGALEYSGEQARALVDAARDLVSMLQRIEEKVVG